MITAIQRCLQESILARAARAKVDCENTNVEAASKPNTRPPSVAIHSDANEIAYAEYSRISYAAHAKSRRKHCATQSCGATKQISPIAGNKKATIMSSSAATATSTRGTGRGGGFRTAKHSSGKRRGDAAQIETTENVRVRCLGAYVMAVVTVGYAVNFVRPDFNDAYALAISQPLMASAADTVWSHYQRVANPMFAPLPANVINGLQLIYPRHITGAVFKHIFGIAGTDGEAGEILFTQVLGPLRAWCLHNSIFSDAALIAEANGHLRTAGSFPAREQFSLPDAHHGLSRHTGVLKAEATEIQAQRDRDDIAAGIAEYAEGDGAAAAAAAVGGAAAAAAAAAS